MRARVSCACRREEMVHRRQTDGSTRIVLYAQYNTNNTVYQVKYDVQSNYLGRYRGTYTTHTCQRKHKRHRLSCTPGRKL